MSIDLWQECPQNQHVTQYRKHLQTPVIISPVLSTTWYVVCQSMYHLQTEVTIYPVLSTIWVCSVSVDLWQEGPQNQCITQYRKHLQAAVTISPVLSTIWYIACQSNYGKKALKISASP